MTLNKEAGPSILVVCLWDYSSAFSWSLSGFGSLVVFVFLLAFILLRGFLLFGWLFLIIIIFLLALIKNHLEIVGRQFQFGCIVLLSIIGHENQPAEVNQARVTINMLHDSGKSIRDIIKVVGYTISAINDRGGDPEAMGKPVSKTTAENIRKFPFDPSNRPDIVLDPDVQTKDMKRTLPIVEPPDRVTKTLENFSKKSSPESSTGGIPFESYLAAGVKLWNFLHSRKLPVEKIHENHKKSQLKQMIIEKEYSQADGEEISHFSEAISNKVNFMYKKYNQHWKQTIYDVDASWAYLLAKAPFDYAAVHRTLVEIKNREPDFQPRTLFDLGSGVGTCTWAAQSVFGEMTEIFAVDPSSDMNDLARAILLEGKLSHSLPAGTFFRLHFPASNDLKYDLVTAAFTLSEMDSAKARLTAVENMWRRTDGYLILVEQGTNAGFQILAEVRDYLIQLIDLNKDIPSDDGQNLTGHLFAPCPHEIGCPRYFQDNIPCNFDVRYKNFQLQSFPHIVKDVPRTEKFSYLIFKKGPKPVESKSYAYPRVVEEPITRSGHIVCRMCTNRGKLEEYMATKNKDVPEKKAIFSYAKRIHCGDQMMVEVHDATPKEAGSFSWKEKKMELKKKKEDLLNQTVSS
eukprot:maker-scaffold1182_size56756-snap-gene-0.7 protein:Tk09770 transcript:maker-scaffold1182_size56756-snap-gene-0.7-mRNA-1 annotation:"hypothetical protein KGM_07295"